MKPIVFFSAPPLGRCVFPNTVLGNIIEFAYGVANKPRFEISGGDKWVSSEPFEVQAVAGNPATATDAELHAMLQTLLRERFGLQFHREVREEQGFALLSAQNGKALAAATGKETRPGAIFVHREGAELVVTIDQATIAMLINFLSSDLHQMVQDETQLTGTYDISLRFTPAAGESTATNADISEPPGPSLFTALQDQLGLKLAPRKVPAEFFVIDHAERPRN